MTLIAGMLSRRGKPLPELACADFANSISRNASDDVQVFRQSTSLFAKVDIGAFGEPGYFEDSTGALSLLAGEPLISTEGTVSSLNRLDELKRIHERVRENDWDVLREANGTFSIAHYQPATSTLTLATDKLGIRPIYYWLDDDLVVFASALRILEQCPLVPKKMDLRAVTEMVGLGTALADRAPYAGISLLKPAEILQVTMGDVSRSYYWRWDEMEASPDSESERLKILYAVFQSAVDSRMRSDKATTAYLSGGLDSRCVVAALAHSDVSLHTVNFARPGTLDYYCGNQFAETLGTVHQSIPKQQGDRVPDYSLLMARAIEKLDQESKGKLAAERPQLVWSGEGGSVLLGHVHLNESIIALMRAGDVDGAIEAYLEREQIHISSKLFRPHVLEDAREVIKQGIRKELDQFQATDPGRNFYLFLVLNDQRRKLAGHFENIDQHRLEFQLPFFDAQFVAAIAATPLDWLMRHKFYVKWLSQFRPEVTAVPWQAYPGHEPCPLPAPTDLGYQWDEGHQAKENAAQVKRVRNRAAELLRAPDFPHKILNRRNLQVAAWIHARGWRDYRYAFEAAATYHTYSRKCGGEFILSLA